VVMTALKLDSAWTEAKLKLPISDCQFLFFSIFES